MAEGESNTDACFRERNNFWVWSNRLCSPTFVCTRGDSKQQGLTHVLTNNSWLWSETELSKLSYKDEIQFLLLCLWMFLQAKWSMLKNAAKTRKLLYLSEFFFSLWISESSRPACSTQTSRGFQVYIKTLSQINNNQKNIEFAMKHMYLNDKRCLNLNIFFSIKA